MKLYIEQKLLTFMPKFNIFIRGIEVRGGFFAHDYNVLQYGSSIMTLNKEWFTKNKASLQLLDKECKLWLYFFEKKLFKRC